MPAETRGHLPRIFTSSKKRENTSFSPTDEWILLAGSTIKLEEREFVVDFGANMHMLIRKDLNSAELETARVSKECGDSCCSQRRSAYKTKKRPCMSKNWIYS